jgi:hypothetical protein
MDGPPGPQSARISGCGAQCLVELSEHGVSAVIWYDDLCRQVPKMAPELAWMIIQISRELPPNRLCARLLRLGQPGQMAHSLNLRSGPALVNARKAPQLKSGFGRIKRAGAMKTTG